MLPLQFFITIPGYRTTTITVQGHGDGGGVYFCATKPQFVLNRPDLTHEPGLDHKGLHCTAEAEIQSRATDNSLPCFPVKWDPHPNITFSFTHFCPETRKPFPAPAAVQLWSDTSTRRGGLFVSQQTG